MLAAISMAVHPKDFIEEILIRDIVCLQTDLQRMRRIKANLASTAKVQALREILDDIDPMLNVVKWAERWSEREPQSIEYVPKLLA